MRKPRRGGREMDTAVEALAEEALAVMNHAQNGHVHGPGMSVLEPEQALELIESQVGVEVNPCTEDEDATASEEDVALKAILEALLFVSAEPLSVERCVSVVGQASKAEVRDALARLQQDYDQRGGALQLVQVAGGYRFVTKSQFAPWIKRLEKTKSQNKLSRSAVEALAIIAYRQPVVRGELEKIRGVETSGVIRTLLERKLVRIVGRKDEPGRPIMYGTTKQFLEQFGLRDLSELPPLREFTELGEGDQASLLDDAGCVEGQDPTETAPAPVDAAPVEGTATATEPPNGRRATDSGTDSQAEEVVPGQEQA